LLKVENIVKSFGPKKVLNSISFEVENGRSLGLLGRNGAGKTTTLRIIMNVFPADSGSVTLNGKKFNITDCKIGYLPEERGLYPKKNIGEQIVYFGELRGLDSHEAKNAAHKWIEKISLSEYWNKRLDTLSKGNQQKIQLAVALINDPDIVILDEPFSGLDPVNAQLLKDIVTEQVKLNKIVIFSSHQMSYVEEFCDNIVMINKGNIVLKGNLQQIKKSYPRTNIELQLSKDNTLETVKSLLSPDACGSKVVSITERPKTSSFEILLSNPDDKDFLLKYLADSGVTLDIFRVIEPTLEQIFVEKEGE
jgi:ABC-2 type transport system ATP-binding protein